ncbi:GNAT family N-acetyltransferase [Clostridium senegalense]|uniref:GNAT family N-acetyltransferase n=1 Tax=Clostridium senegalense TaxID=1465809 RepID=A0A6M0H2M9_9CLOT|nr:GNAT family N-acetyltransferase [Clostridium senegalense]NEU04975.1 GNAT family N-acetyltransferase [Clostridium senegalense]
MNYLIRRVENKELDKAFSLIWNVFSEFVAPDYSKEAVDNFKNNFIESEEFKERFKSGKQFMYGAYLKEEITGIISVSENNHVSCVFVDKEFHRKGIATNLFNYMIAELREKKVKKITLNASPYAVPFYHEIGFKDLGK